MVRATRQKRYYESPPPDSDRSDSGRPPKIVKKETNPIKEHYSQNPDSESPKAETSTSNENMMEKVRRASQEAIKTAFSEPEALSQSATSDKLADPEKKDQYDISDEKIDINSIRIEHLDRAINHIKEMNEVLEERNIHDKSKENQNKINQNYVLETLNVLNDFKGMITPPEADLESRQIYWDYISGENILNNPYLKEATDLIKDATRHKKQNTDVTAQGTPEPIKRETSPTTEAGPSQSLVSSFELKITEPS